MSAGIHPWDRLGESSCTQDQQPLAKVPEVPGSLPDLIKDQEVFAIALVEEPIRFVEFERERGEWC